VLIKRGLRDSEYQETRRRRTISPRKSKVGVQNEAAALRFVSANTKIPVPKVIAAYEDDGAYILITEYLCGVPLEDLRPSEQKIVFLEVRRPYQDLKCVFVWD